MTATTNGATTNDTIETNNVRIPRLGFGLAAIKGVTEPRFKQQADRIGGFLRNMFGKTSAMEREEVQAQARATNRPAYERAYAAGDRPVWSPTLEQLVTAPAVQEAMGAAVSKWRNWVAGKEFVMRNADIDEATKALGKMTQPQREQFALGFASELADRIDKIGYNQNVLKSIFVNSNDAKRKMFLALGTDRARQLETLLRVEGIVDRLRQAMGNSWTARQLIQSGVSHAAVPGAVGAFELIKEHDFNPVHLIGAALVFGSMRKGAKVIDEQVARRVGELLASNDPAIFQRGLQIVSKSPTYLEALRNFPSAVARVATGEIQPSSTLAGAATVLHRLFHGKPEHESHPAGSDYQQDYIQQVAPTQ